MSRRLLRTIIIASVVAIPLMGADSRPSKHAAKRPAVDHLADLRKLRAEAAPKEQYLVSGRGLKRAGLGNCEADLSAFKKSLRDRKLTLLEEPACVALENEPDTYAPSFRATSPEPIVLESKTGGRFNSMTFCELNAQRIAKDLAKSKGVHVLEVACRSQANNEVYEAEFAVISPTDDLAKIKAYSSIEMLVESAHETTTKSLVSEN